MAAGVAGGSGTVTTAASVLGGQADASLVRVLGNFPGCVLVLSKLNSEGPVFASIMLSLFVVHTTERA